MSNNLTKENMMDAIFLEYLDKNDIHSETAQTVSNSLDKATENLINHFNIFGEKQRCCIYLQRTC